MLKQAILPGTTSSGQQTTLGVMGGGQLGRMFVHAAQRMGYFTAVLDPDPASPAGLVSHFHVQADYLDTQALAQMMQHCAAITTEFENVPSGAMRTLGEHRTVSPSSRSLAIAQDRMREKAHFKACGVPTAPYAVISTAQELASVDDALLPGILKTARLGYDGKGQVRVRDRAELAAAWAQLKSVACVLERQLDLRAECSVLVARGWDGAMVTYPVQRNLHRDGILAMTEVFDGNLAPELAESALHAARAVAQELQYVGVLCVEFFVVAQDCTASAQQRTLHVGCLRRIPVRPAGAHAGGLAFDATTPAQPGHHAEPARRPVVRRARPSGWRRTTNARLVSAAGLAWRPSASVRQTARQPWPQDGPPDDHRGVGGPGARNRAAGGQSAGSGLAVSAC